MRGSSFKTPSYPPVLPKGMLTVHSNCKHSPYHRAPSIWHINRIIKLKRRLTLLQFCSKTCLQLLTKSTTGMFGITHFTWRQPSHNCKPFDVDLEQVVLCSSHSASKIAAGQCILLKHVFFNSKMLLLIYVTCSEILEALFWKTKAPRLNVWTILESPERNLNCTDILPLIIQLPSDKNDT